MLGIPASTIASGRPSTGALRWWVGRIAKPCEQVLRKVAAKHRAEILALEIMPDQVHCRVEVDPEFGIPRLVKHLKGVSSHRLRQEFGTLRDAAA